MFLDIDLSLTPQKPKLYLCKPNKTIIASLKEYSSATLRINLTALNELVFCLPYQLEKNHQSQYNNHCSALKNRYLIKMILGETTSYYIINNPAPNADDDIDFFEINCYSLEYELKDRNIRSYKVDSVLLSEVMNGFTREVNTIPVTTDGILKNTPWILGELPETCSSMYRSFDVSVKTKLDFILEVAEKFNLIAQFDSINRKINFSTIDNAGTNKGLRISNKRYLKTIVQNIDSETFCTRLKVYGKDGLTINSITPNAQGHIENYSYFLFPFQRDENRNVIYSSDYMSDELCHAILDYQILFSQSGDSFNILLAELTTLQTELTTLENEMKILTDAMVIINDNLATADGSKKTQYIADKVAKQLEIDAKNIEITAITTSLSYDVFLADAPELLKELNDSYIIDRDWTNDSIVNPTDLYLFGLDEMESRKHPVTIIQISIVNFLEILSEQRNWNKINIGDSIAIKHEQLGIDITAKIIAVNFDFEEAEVQLTISNVKTGSQKLSDSLYKTTSIVDIIDINKQKWDESLITAKEYVDQQIEEMSGTLLNLGIDIERFASDGYITKDEAKTLKLTLEQAISESEDILLIAEELEITTEADNYNNALDALELELTTKWIGTAENPLTYPIIITLEERTIITNLFKAVENTKSILINTISKVRQTDAIAYVDNQVTELNTALSAFQIQVNTYITAGKITEAESNILDPLFVAVQTESSDIITIANQLKTIVEGTDLTNLNSATDDFSDAMTDAFNSIDDWLNKLSSAYPIFIKPSKEKTVKNYLKKVETAKETLNALITQVTIDNELTYTDQQIFEVNVAIVSMQTDIASFAKDNWITYEESVSLTNSFNTILAESLDVIEIANSMSVSPTLINNYQNSLTGTIASCGVDGLEVELNKWIGWMETDYPRKMKTSERKALLNKFKLVMSTKLALNNAITLETPEYSIDGEISIRGTGANNNSSRFLKLNKKNISASGGSGTGLMLTVISREDLSITFTQLYDTYNSNNVGKDDLATKLNSLDDAVIVTLTSYNSIGWNQNLLDVIVKCGGTGTDTGTGKFPFAFIGIPGLFKGSALEVFCDSGSNAPYANITTKIVDGTPQGIAIGTSVISAQASLAVQTAIADRDVAMVDITKVATTTATTVTSTEKKLVKKYWDAIVSEKSNVELQASFYNTVNYPDVVSTLTTYETFYSNLNTYITPILSVMTSNSTIVSATFINTFKAYYDAKIALLKAIMGVARNYIGDAVAGLAESLIGLSLEINDAFNDSKIFEPEATKLASDLASVIAESTPLITLATSLGLDKIGETEKIDYQNALSSLSTLLNTWIDKDSSLYPFTVTGDDKNLVKTYFSSVQTTKSLLLNKISMVQLDNANASAAEQIIEFNNTVIADLQTQVDGKVETWFSGYLPSLTNSPANKWTKDTLKDAHLGDLFYNTASGLAYKFTLTGSTYSWTQITDTAIVSALQQASIAIDTSDGIRRIFTQTPTPPYDIGDLWSQGVDGDLLICIVKKSLGSSYLSTDWVKSSKYTDDTIAQEARDLATQAQIDADLALDNLADIANNNKITKDEKVKTLKPIWDTIVVEKTNLDAQVLLYPSSTMTTYYGTYVSSYNAVDTYLNVTILPNNTSNPTPILGDLTKTTNINRDEFNSKFNTYYSTRGTLLNYIASSAKTYADTKSPIYGVLDNESTTISTDSLGNNGIYTGAVSRIYIYNGSTDDSANWTVTALSSSGVTGSLSGKTYTVTNMTVDTGYVDFTATKSGQLDIIKRFSLAKSKSGTNSTSYWLITDAPAVGKSITGVYTPSSIIITGKSQSGVGTPINYSCRFKVEDSTDGINYTVKYTSSIDESTKTYSSFAAGIKTLRISMYLAGGTSTLLDQQIIQIVSDGINGLNSYNAYLSYTGQVFSINKSGVVSPSSIVLTMNLQNIDASPIPAYAWYKDDVLISGATSSTYTVSQFLITDKQHVYKCIVTGAKSNGVTCSSLSDTVTIIQVNDGIDSYNIFLTNESVTLPSDNSGNITSYVGANTGFKVYHGTTDVSSSHTMYLNAKSDVNIILSPAITSSVGTTGTISITSVPVGIDSGYVDLDIKATSGGTLIGTKRFNYSKAKKGIDGINTIIGSLSNDAQTIGTDSIGNGGVYTNAVTTMKVYSGVVDDTANWTFTASPLSGVVGSLVSNTYTVTDMTVDTGYVDITASRGGYANIVKRFTLAKSKSGAIGQNAISYWLVLDTSTIAKSITGVYTPLSLNLIGKYQTGTGIPTNYSGRFKIEDSVDGITYTSRYTSSVDEDIKNYTSFTAGIKTMRISLYLSGGITTLLDQQIVPIVSDGATGGQGIQGNPGADGTPRYTWVKYGTDSIGTGLTDDPTGMTYIGLAHNKLTDIESTIASDYTWAKILDTSAILLLADMANDSKLTPIEKKIVKREWDVIYNEYNPIISNASSYGVYNSPEYIAYNDAYWNLRPYLIQTVISPNTKPLLYDLTTTSDIVRTDFLNFFQTYYTAKETLFSMSIQYSASSTNGKFDKTTSAPTGTTRLNYSGYFYPTKTFNAVYNDYAEYFLKDEEIEAGDVICKNPNGNGYIKSRYAYDNLVVGIYSDDFAQCIGGEGSENDSIKFAPVGMAGRVRVKVTGKVKIGDLLVASSIPGVAMSSTDYIHGTVIGKALENYSGQDISRIWMLIMVT